MHAKYMVHKLNIQTIWYKEYYVGFFGDWDIYLQIKF